MRDKELDPCCETPSANFTGLHTRLPPHGFEAGQAWGIGQGRSYPPTPQSTKPVIPAVVALGVEWWYAADREGIDHDVSSYFMLTPASAHWP